MAYVLGFLYADGNITDAVSSRTQYITFVNTEREIIEKIKEAIESRHPIHSRPPRIATHYNGRYLSRELFELRIGSRKMFNDLITIGVVPNKSKIAKFPKIPKKFLHHFVRGYFNGDGCVYVEYSKGKIQKRILKRMRSIFISGSKIFLEELQYFLLNVGNIERGRIYHNSRAFRLVYPTSSSIKLFKFIYKNKGKLFLERKYKIFQDYIIDRQKVNYLLN